MFATNDAKVLGKGGRDWSCLVRDLFVDESRNDGVSIRAGLYECVVYDPL